jgi:tetratricopeptide (TPR) repeat protein
VAAAERLTDPHAQAHAHRLLARACLQTGQLNKAHRHLSHALDQSIQAGDQAGQAHTHVDFGQMRERQGRHTEALNHSQQALDLGHRYNEATTLINLGDTQHTTNHPEAARNSWQHALAILNDLGHPDAEQVRTRLHSLDHPTGSAHTATDPASHRADPTDTPPRSVR